MTGATEPVRPLPAVRAVGVMLGGSVLLDFLALTSVLRVAKSLRSARCPTIAPALGLIATILYALRMRPWMLRWGATEAEAEAPLPGDELAAGRGMRPTRAVTIDAPPAQVWPWLAQIGQDRGGFYSYEWLENLAGCRMRNASEIDPDWQQREVGEKVLLHPALGLEVARFEQGRALVLDGWGAFVLEPHVRNRTRLVARGRGAVHLLDRLYEVLLMEMPHFLMERKMLLGIKERAERRV